MTLPQWISLYVPGADRAALIAAVESALTAAGAATYDPFGTMPGLSYQRAVRLFVAPEEGAWLRLIASPDCVLEPVITAASMDVPVMAGFISAELTPTLTAYRGGHLVEAVALSPYLRDLAGFASHLNLPKTGASTVGGISSAALPAHVRAMSSGLPARQVERLMTTMTGSLSRGDRASAQATLQSVDWYSGAGLWMREALEFLGISDVTPDYPTLSTAYRTAKRLTRKPDATLYPGDAEAQEAVPNALDYAPVFYGWKA